MSVRFIVFDEHGAILRTGSCPRDMLALQARRGERVIEGVARDESDRVENGRIVPAPAADPAIAAQGAALTAARRLLASTDWMVVRAAETGKQVPPEIARKRAEARALLSGELTKSKGAGE